MLGASKYIRRVYPTLLLPFQSLLPRTTVLEYSVGESEREIDFSSGCLQRLSRRCGIRLATENNRYGVGIFCWRDRTEV